MFVLKNLSLEEVPANRFGGDPNGKLLIFEQPYCDREYFIGVDVGSGQGLSNSVIQVVKAGNIHEPNEQVAEFACNFLDPHQLAPVVNHIGNMYWNEEMDLPAQVAIEVYPGPGEGTQYDLMTYYNYPNLYQWKVLDNATGLYTTKMGWTTSGRSRKRIIMWADHQLTTYQLLVNSPWLIDEFSDFEIEDALESVVRDSELMVVREAKEKARAKTGKKDDRIMALFIAEWTASEMRVEAVDPAAERAAFGERQAAQREGPRRDFQNTDCSATDFWEEGSRLY